MSNCVYCGQGYDLTRDHVVPFSVLTSGRRRGGAHGFGETVTACRECNTILGDRYLNKKSLRSLYLVEQYANRLLYYEKEDGSELLDKIKSCILIYEGFSADESLERDKESTHNNSDYEMEEETDWSYRRAERLKARRRHEKRSRKYEKLLSKETSNESNSDDQEKNSYSKGTNFLKYKAIKLIDIEDVSVDEAAEIMKTEFRIPRVVDINMDFIEENIFEFISQIETASSIEQFYEILKNYVTHKSAKFDQLLIAIFFNGKLTIRNRVRLYDLFCRIRNHSRVK